jgi:phosphoadenosine phosphosulfate reductase
VLTAVIAENHIAIPVFTLDTGRLFPETYELIARTSERYVPVRVYFPDATEVEEMVVAHGIDLFRDSVAARKRCCEVRKVRPLRRAQAGLEAWACGLRSGQGATRKHVDVVEWDEAAALVKINPLASWSEDDVWAYAREHDVVYNPLHDSGFPSIGCAPCTRAIEPGEDVRAGRWWWESAEQRECGLHAHRERMAVAVTEAAATDTAPSPNNTGASR